jgi:putative DNA primase/helicase
MPNKYFNSFNEETVSPVIATNATPAAENLLPTLAELSTKIFDEINARALRHHDDIFEQLGLLFLSHYQGNTFVCPSPFGKNPDELLEFDIATVAWIDQGEYDAKGVGMVSLKAHIDGYTPSEAATLLEEYLDEHYPEIYCPSNATVELDFSNANVGNSSYTSTSTLYGLDCLDQNSDDPDPVLLSFGEQAAYAARFLLPGYVSMAIKNGADIDKVDFSPLKGRSVFIWPDHGEAGQENAKSVTAALFKMDRKATVFKLKPLMYLPEWLVDLSIDPLNRQHATASKLFDLKARVEALHAGYNSSDALAEGWTAGFFCEVFWKLVRPVQFTFEIQKVGYFLVKEDGVYEVRQNKEGDEFEVLISSCIEVEALTRDAHNQNWGLLLTFHDRDGIRHEWAMPKEMLAGKGDEYRQVLLSRGADIYSGANTKLTDYFIEANPSDRALCVNSIGWHGEVFVLPAKSYGKSVERVILQTVNARKVSPYAISGTLQDWQTNIGAKCVGNSRIILAVCVALTGPLLDALKLENGGFHFRGQSSTGKTKTLSVAGSIYGGKAMVRIWRATGNAVESLARENNDCVLLLDELGQVNPQEAGDIAYTLANGQTKARANVNGDAKETSNWRLLFISTGEIGLAEHVVAGGGQIKAGQEVRMLDIPAEAGAGYGVFENIHGATSPATFADSLQTLSETFYGSPADALLNKLTEPGELERAAAYIRQLQNEFVRQYVRQDAHGQVIRASARFGAVAGVG